MLPRAMTTSEERPPLLTVFTPFYRNIEYFEETIVRAIVSRGYHRSDYNHTWIGSIVVWPYVGKYEPNVGRSFF